MAEQQVATESDYTAVGYDDVHVLLDKLKNKIKINTEMHHSTCSNSSVLWCGEEVALGDGDGGQSQYAHHDQVDETRLRRAVEGVVQPGDK